MPKLSDTQSILLAHAARHDSCSVHPLPVSLLEGNEPSARALTAIGQLLKRNLLEERHTTTAAEARRTDGDIGYGVFVTTAGLAAIGVEVGSSEADVSAASPARGVLLGERLQRRERGLVRELVDAVRVERGRIVIRCLTGTAAALLQLEPNSASHDAIKLIANVRLTRSGHSMRLVDPGGVPAERHAGTSLVRLLAHPGRLTVDVPLEDMHDLTVYAEASASAPGKHRASIYAAPVYNSTRMPAYRDHCPEADSRLTAQLQPLCCASRANAGCRLPTEPAVRHIAGERQQSPTFRGSASSTRPLRRADQST